MSGALALGLIGYAAGAVCLSFVIACLVGAWLRHISKDYPEVD